MSNKDGTEVQYVNVTHIRYLMSINSAACHKSLLQAAGYRSYTIAAWAIISPNGDTEGRGAICISNVVGTLSC